MSAAWTKEKLADRSVELINKASSLLTESAGLDALAELRQDLREDCNSVVVVGEFKHGKSTFINALLGREIMPADVAPTTATINTVIYDSNERVEVLNNDGSTETYPLTAGILDRYTASAEFDPGTIQFLRIYCNAPFMNKDVMLVDTPGVGDLNKHRAEITYRFIPRADVLIFMLDMTAPFRRSEQEFIEQHLLNKGTDHILYVANFADRIDEGEMDSVIQRLERRLAAMTGHTGRVLPISAKEALLGTLRQDEELLNQSGLRSVELAIREIAGTSGKAENKLRNYLKRYGNALRLLHAEASAACEMTGKDIETLLGETQRVEAFLSRREMWESQIADYLSEQEEEIAYMAVKSFDYFAERLRKDIGQRIQHFQGGDIKILAESQLPLHIGLQFSQWTDQYAGSLHTLFYRLEQEVGQGLMNVFEQSVNIKAYKEDRLELNAEGAILMQRTVSAPVKAGLLVGGVGAAALLVGAPFIIPVVGMAGLPFISQKLAEKQLERAKPELLAAAEIHLNSLFDESRALLRNYVKESVNVIGTQTIREFSRLVEGAKASLEMEITVKKETAVSKQVRRDELLGLVDLISSNDSQVREGEVTNGQLQRS
ncbi:dynamin family protein [Paenibacillus rhizophilus]|uniref:dynamin family protein n=1 Tax=Paenibacillus rhizophilus TaxID=1850366 RepID=UPI00163B237B|nr:dynamin family protein [Paenibacillus rhizophilus]